MEMELPGTTIPAKIRQMTPEEADTALNWAALEGWNPGIHDAESFYQTDPGGFFTIEVNGVMAGCVSLVRYSDDFMFGGLYIVHPDYRDKGIGRAVLGFVMKYAEHYNFGIDGVYAMQALYEKVGFKFAYRNIRYEGTIDGTPDTGLTAIRRVPFPRILAYDSLFFPAVREKFLKHFLYQRDGTGYALTGGDAVKGYGFIRKCMQGYKIGPLFADTPEIAEQIFQALCYEAEGEAVYLDVPETNPAGVALAKFHGMTEVFGTARMYTREIPRLPIKKIFGVTTFELG